MDNSKTLLIVLGAVILLGIAMFPWGGSSGGICNIMGNWNYGSGGYGLGMVISYIANIAVLILVALGVYWLVKQIQKK